MCIRDRRSQTKFSHVSCEKVVELKGSCLDKLDGKLICSKFISSSSLLSKTVNMLRTQVVQPVLSTSKRSSEGDRDRDGDDRKRRPPARKPSPDDRASFRPRRCRKCKAQGKKGRKYRSAKGLREHCVCHHACTYRAVTDRYLLLTPDECSRQIAAIQASRRHRPAGSSYFAAPPTRSTGRHVKRVEAVPTTASHSGKSTTSPTVSLVKLQGVDDSRQVVLHPNRLPSLSSCLLYTSPSPRD